MRDLDVFQSVLGEVRVGEPVVVGALGLVPLFGARRAPDYLLAEAATKAGLFAIEETGSGIISKLVASNRAPQPVLLLEGEQLLGGLQDRVLNLTILVPAETKLRIPVSCVEPGRWHYRGSTTAAMPGPAFVSPRVRAVKTASVVRAMRVWSEPASDQGAVWRAVHEDLEEAAVSSPTGALREAYRQRAGDLEGIERGVGVPAPEQTGVIACVAGRPITLDLFDRPETLAQVWPRLVRSYALDALWHEAVDPSPEEAQVFLAALRAAEVTAHDAIGLGTDIALSGRDLAGGALVWEGAIVHLAALRPAETGVRRRGVGDRSRRGRGSGGGADAGSGTHAGTGPASGPGSSSGPGSASGPGHAPDHTTSPDAASGHGAGPGMASGHHTGSTEPPRQGARRRRWFGSEEQAQGE